MSDENQTPEHPGTSERLEQAEALARRQREDITRIENSLSWRITSPLRGIKRALGGGRAAAGANGDGPTDGAQAGETSPAVAAASVRGMSHEAVFKPEPSDAHELWRQPWRDAETPPVRVFDVPTMLSSDELRLLYWLTHDYWSGAGKVLDGGCFFGGSTNALATGLATRPEPPTDPSIVTYDLFELDPFMLNYFDDDTEFEEGDSFRPVFDRHLAGYEHLLTVREGDITAHGWSGEPIEIAFLDVLKSWPINDFVLEHFFGSLIPGRSIIVQQDFVHEFAPWIHVTMGMLDPYVELLDLLEEYSAVYLLREPIPDEVLKTRTRRDLSAEQIVAYMDKAIAPATGEVRGVLEIAKAYLLRLVDGEPSMAAHLAAIRAAYSDSQRVTQGATMVEAWATLVGTWGIKLRGQQQPSR